LTRSSTTWCARRGRARGCRASPSAFGRTARSRPAATARELLSHRAGLRCESLDPLPPEARGLFSYSNAGYWAVGEACAQACGSSFEEAVRSRLIEPLGLTATGFEEPPAPARGHVQAGARGHRTVEVDAYPAWRRPSGGLWSTVADVLGFAAHQLGGDGPLSAAARARLREPQAEALGARYGLGFWLREAGGEPAIEHEGSAAGYQSLLLLLPQSRRALAVLTNSWRGSTFVRRLLVELGLAAPAAPARGDDAGGLGGFDPAELAGRYVLDDAEGAVMPEPHGLRVELAEVDPVTGARLAAPPALARPLGRGVFGFADGVLLGHRLDFPRAGIGRIGWVAMPRVSP
jgi:CubicO group peptidase (beta-lactamase class C family)